ncbi:7-dehydrocholesterol reductase [Ilyonectria sp. MPI-CAGE-AT-0026]|nr:7-dehydrocholesterol reductase [Ilyonectria sp. MPI-CAGE-AT-0026]
MYERQATEKKDIVFDKVTSFVLITTSPLFLLFYWITHHYFDASITSAASELISNNPFDFFSSRIPQLTKASVLAYSLWVIVQALLYVYVPGKLHIAPRTPGGRQLKYRLNGLRVWILSVGGAAMLCYNGILDPAFIAIHWGNLLMTANAYALILVLTFWIKARIKPDHQGDTLITGNFFYDLYNGGELHPRIGELFDWKHFNASRTGGIVTWTLMFFDTLDGAHERFSFYNIYGFTAMMPQIWTLQTQYLAHHPVTLSGPALISAVLLFSSGWALNHTVNRQKNLVRATRGDCTIWGQKPRCIVAKYKTADGKTHQTQLLCSGWWGQVRHANYVGSALYTWASCAICGTDSLFPYAEAILVTVTVIHRCFRDEGRCQTKYGKAWDEYCDLVRWRLIPGVF